MSAAKLKKAPLKEVIFELHWECDIDTSGVQVDKGFDLAQGKFADKLKSEFPLHRKLIPDGIPFRIIGMPLHQYWKGESVWPVIQHGQGMMAVNEVEEGYVWTEGFKPMVEKTIKLLIDSYENVPNFNKTRLIYVDAWDIDEGEPIDFMIKNLQTNIITDYPHPGKRKEFNIRQTFEIFDSSTMIINISNGTNNSNQKKSVISTTTVERQFPLNIDQIVPWLDMAHTETSTSFKQMLNPTFYASLDR